MGVGVDLEIVDIDSLCTVILVYELILLFFASLEGPKLRIFSNLRMFTF